MAKAVPKVAIVSGSFETAAVNLFKTIAGWGLTTNPKDADVLVLLGGGDINPNLYHEAPIFRTYGVDSRRDTAETKLYDMFHDKPKIGICRGAQLMNVLNGGKMYQDVDGHESQPHETRDLTTNKLIKMTSMHHQMMIPSDTGQLIAVACRTKHYETAAAKTTRDIIRWDDTEVVWYPNSKALCYQAHPEIGADEERRYFFELLSRYFAFDPPKIVTSSPVDYEQLAGMVC